VGLDPDPANLIFLLAFGFCLIVSFGLDV